MAVHFHPQPKPEPRALVKIGRRAEELAHWAVVCKAVDKRDDCHCRACHHRCNPKALAMVDRAHRHHVIYRSAGGPDETWNVALLCVGCHDQQHRLGLLDVRGNADTGLEIWRNGEGGWFMSKRETSVGVFEHD